MDKGGLSSPRSATDCKRKFYELSGKVKKERGGEFEFEWGGMGGVYCCVLEYIFRTTPAVFHIPPSPRLAFCPCVSRGAGTETTADLRIFNPAPPSYD